ncbi:hypothetical protein LTR35_018272, partial [Friedmanniomyces endolithicus]
LYFKSRSSSLPRHLLQHYRNHDVGAGRTMEPIRQRVLRRKELDNRLRLLRLGGLHSAQSLSRPRCSCGQSHTCRPSGRTRQFRSCILVL